MTSELLDALASLQHTRDTLQTQLASVDRAIAALHGVVGSQPRGASEGSRDAEAATSPPHGVAPTFDRTAGSRSSRLLQLMQTDARHVWEARDLAVGLGEEANPDTMKKIFAILSRLVRSGDVVKVSRGRYRVNVGGPPLGTAGDGVVASVRKFS